MADVVGAKKVELTVSEATTCVYALVQMEKSILRMAAKPGVPENVSVEYRKSATSVANLIRKLNQ